MKLADWQLKNIINFENSEYRYAICFTNASYSLMDEIKDVLKDNTNATNIIIDARNMDLTNYELVKDTIPEDLDIRSISKLLFESMIYGKIITNLLNMYPNELSRYIEGFKETLEAFNNNLEATHFNDINVKGIIMWNMPSDMLEKLKRENKSVTINVFIPLNFDYKMQASLNTLLNDRYPFHTRFYINSDSLTTYYTSNNDIIEEMHDYHERDLSEVLTLKNPIKIKK